MATARNDSSVQPLPTADNPTTSYVRYLCNRSGAENATYVNLSAWLLHKCICLGGGGCVTRLCLRVHVCVCMFVPGPPAYVEKP